MEENPEKKNGETLITIHVECLSGYAGSNCMKSPRKWHVTTTILRALNFSLIPLGSSHLGEI